MAEQKHKFTVKQCDDAAKILEETLIHRSELADAMMTKKSARRMQELVRMLLDKDREEGGCRYFHEVEKESIQAALSIAGDIFMGMAKQEKAIRKLRKEFHT